MYCSAALDLAIFSDSRAYWYCICTATARSTVSIPQLPAGPNDNQSNRHSNAASICFAWSKQADPHCQRWRGHTLKFARTLQISRKSSKIHENPRLQYFGLGPVRLWAKHSQTVWDKILHLSSKFWGNLGFQKKMKERYGK